MYFLRERPDLICSSFAIWCSTSASDSTFGVAARWWWAANAVDWPLTPVWPDVVIEVDVECVFMVLILWFVSATGQKLTERTKPALFRELACILHLNTSVLRNAHREAILWIGYWMNQHKSDLEHTKYKAGSKTALRRSYVDNLCWIISAWVKYYSSLNILSNIDVNNWV